MHLPSAQAQWARQTLTLQPGWNAVFLEVSPEPADCDAIFAGLPIESVWKWNRTFSPVQFIQNPDELLPGRPDWLTYVPPAHPARSAINLHILQGGFAYLIKLSDTASPMNWQLTGRPSLRSIDWISDSFNLVGFHLVPGAGPTVQNFFANAPAHAARQVYRLNASGIWTLLGANSTLRSGEAYWVYASGASSFNGLIEVVLEQGTGLDYGRALVEQTLRVRNLSPSPTTLVLRQLPSEQPPPGASPLAGPVLLSHFVLDPAAQTNRVRWDPLPTPFSRTVTNGSGWSVRLEARRRDFAPPPPGPRPLYQSVIEITDGRGSRWLAPVSADGIETVSTAFGPLAAAALEAGSDQTIDKRAGLWVGTVELGRINQPANVNDSSTAVPTAAPFAFRIMVHVDTNGQARLLQNVVQLWKKGVPGDTNHPGRFLLFSGRQGSQLVAQYGDRLTGATIRDGQFAGRRLSTAAFTFSDPLLMIRSGEIGAAGSTLVRVIDVGFDDPLNPYKHRFHPDHDNLDDRYERVLEPVDSEAYAISRSIVLTFTANNPQNNAAPGWGDSVLGGEYQETIRGIHKDQIIVSGIFVLNYACNVNALNEPL